MPNPLEPAVSRPPRRARRLAFAAIGLVLLYLALEGATWLAVVALRDGGFAAIERARAAAAIAMGGRATSVDGEARGADAGAAAVEFNEPLRPHPYVGYVLDPTRNYPGLEAIAGQPISPFGFKDDKSPIAKRDSRHVVVGVFGGSVASMLSRYGAESLRAELRRHPAFADKRIVIQRCAVGGYKQPQQLLLFEYLCASGAEFDVVVNLDGFNELVLPLTDNRARGTPLAYPRSWTELQADRDGGPELLRALARVEVLLVERRESATALAASPWSWSPIARVLWSLGDSRRASALAAARADLAAASAGGAARDIDPLGAFEDDAAARTAAVDLWVRCSAQFAAAAAAHGARYLQFLQPNQYVPGGSKALTDDERRDAFDDDSAYRPHVEAGYPLAQAAAAARFGDRVAFHDLTGLFRDVTETVWVDRCCHLNQRGNELLAVAIARAIVASTPRPAAAAAGIPDGPLTVEPTNLAFKAPFASTALTVRVGARDVTFADVTYSTSDPTVADVDAWGEVDARGSGSCVVTAVRGASRIEVPVVVACPAVVDLDGATSWRRGERLRLEVEASTDELVFRVAGATAGRPAMVGVTRTASRRALCGGHVVVLEPGAQNLPLDLTPDGAVLRVPVSPAWRGQSVFVQVLVPESSRTCPWALSNGLYVRVP